jgi:hypothetical protein
MTAIGIWIDLQSSETVGTRWNERSAKIKIHKIRQRFKRTTTDERVYEIPARGGGAGGDSRENNYVIALALRSSTQCVAGSKQQHRPFSVGPKAYRLRS